MENFEQVTEREKVLRRIRKLRDLIEHASTADTIRQASIGRMRVLRDKFAFSEEELSTTEKPDIVEQKYTLPMPALNVWPSLLIASICSMYSCNMVMLQLAIKGSSVAALHSIFIVGDEIDATCAKSVLDYIIPQTYAYADKLWSWAYEIKHNKKETKKETLDYDSFFMGMGILSGFQNERKIKDVLSKYLKMPERDSLEWAQIENDWGLGLIAKVIERLNTLMANANHSDSDDDESVVSGLVGHEYRSNQLVVSNRYVAERVSQQKMANAVAYLDSKEGVHKKAISGELKDVKHKFLFHKGHGDGRDVDIKEDIIKKGDK